MRVIQASAPHEWVDFGISGQVAEECVHLTISILKDWSVKQIPLLKVQIAIQALPSICCRSVLWAFSSDSWPKIVSTRYLVKICFPVGLGVGAEVCGGLSGLNLMMPFHHPPRQMCVKRIGRRVAECSPSLPSPPFTLPLSTPATLGSHLSTQQHKMGLE